MHLASNWQPLDDFSFMPTSQTILLLYSVNADLKIETLNACDKASACTNCTGLGKLCEITSSPFLITTLHLRFSLPPSGVSLDNRRFLCVHAATQRVGERSFAKPQDPKSSCEIRPVRLPCHNFHCRSSLQCRAAEQRSSCVSHLSGMACKPNTRAG